MDSKSNIPVRSNIHFSPTFYNKFRGAVTPRILIFSQKHFIHFYFYHQWQLNMKRTWGLADLFFGHQKNIADPAVCNSSQKESRTSPSQNLTERFMTRRKLICKKVTTCYLDIYSLLSLLFNQNRRKWTCRTWHD